MYAQVLLNVFKTYVGLERHWEKVLSKNETRWSILSYTNVLRSVTYHIECITKCYEGKESLTEFQTELSLFGDEKSREGIEELSTIFTLHFYHWKREKKTIAPKRTWKIAHVQILILARKTLTVFAFGHNVLWVFGVFVGLHSRKTIRFTKRPWL